MSLRRLPPVHSPLSLQALLSGAAAWSGLGSNDSWLVATLASDFTATRVVLTNSGTDALTLALRSAGLRVAMPGYGCYDLATAALGADAEVLWYDLDPLTLGPTSDSLEVLRREGVDAILVAHLYGLPVDVDRVRAALPDVLIIDDAAQGVGGELAGRPLGGVGDLGVLSFGRGKGRTGGGGGALLATTPRGTAALEASPVAAAIVPRRGSLRQIAVTTAQWLLSRPPIYGVPAAIPALGLGETPFHPPVSPRGMAAFSVGVLRVAWELSEREAVIRRQQGDWWRDALGGEGLRVRPLRPTGRPGWLRFPVLTDPVDMHRWRGREARALGVMPGYPQSLADLPGMDRRTRLPLSPSASARILARTLYTFPVHSQVRPVDRERLLRLARR